MLALTFLSLNLYLIFCEVGIMHVLMYFKFRAVYMNIHRLPCTNASSHSLLFDWEKSCIEPSSAQDDVGRRTSSLLLSRSNYSQRHASSSAAAPLQESRAYSSYSSSALALVLMVPLVLARLGVLELHSPRKGRSRGRERMAFQPWALLRALFVFVDLVDWTAVAAVVSATPIVSVSVVEDLA